MNDDLKLRVKKNDLQALSEFIQANRNPLMAFIEQQLGTALRRKVEPDDIFQELSAEAIRALPDMEFGDREPMSWLFQIAQRKIIDSHRYHFQSQKRDAGKEIGIFQGNDDGDQGIVQMLIASMTSASQVYSRQVKEDRVSLAMKQLAPDQQEALRLRYMEDLPSKAIAERLGKSDASVRVMLTRALKKLQEILAVDPPRSHDC